MEYNKNSPIAQIIKKIRKEHGLTQVDFSHETGLGLRFVRELEQGKQTVRLDKVNQALAFYGYEVGVCKRENQF